MNSLGSSKEIVQNKLIIMYILKKLGIPAGNSHITHLVLETRLMNYFMFQQCLNELLESGLAGASGDGTKSYVLTETGGKTLQYFLNLIPEGIKKQLDNQTSNVRRDIRDETLITADFIPEGENQFTAVCKIGEKDFPLIELRTTVGTKKDARSICDNWKNHSSEIYAEIIDSLTKQRGKTKQEQ
ncbi:MAG TPA: DUF4364 family protein [Clostridia bacterium]|nr:DUF4364 family protein [Clostridia bacterium]